jgi:heat shock protein HslJ/uncharacterized membrane protein
MYALRYTTLERNYLWKVFNLNRKEMKRTILLFMTGVALCSCQINKSVLSTNYIAGTTYSGTVACDDCNGIKQVVLLDSNNRFKLSETYLGKGEQCTEKSGTWSMQNGRVMLFADEAPIAEYAVSGGNLVYLAENKPTRGNVDQGMLLKKKLIRSKKINGKFLKGLDIVAFGADASWSLDITHNKAIQFSVAGLEAPIAFSPVVPKYSGDSLVYDVITSKEKMNIVFAPGFCGDGENLYDYKVTIRFRGKTFYGCGAVLNADGGLDGTWLLQSFDAHESNWKERPYLVIDINEKKVYGFAGCNQFAGTTRLRETNVCFSDINASSKETCTNYDEAGFIETLVKCNSYKITERTLELIHNGRTIMIFQRQLDDSEQP